MKVYTIGYEGATADDFQATLKLFSIDVLVDIRELPISRRKGFAKTALSTALNVNGIKYVHMKQLGDPKPGRIAARSGDMDAFRTIFNQHMQKSETIEAMESLASIAKESNACLLCYERNHRDCHRSIVADQLELLHDFEVSHVGVLEGLANNARVQERARNQLGQSYTSRW